MGFLQEKLGVTMLGRTPPGTCPLCAAAHSPNFPHNRDSLTYQYRFYDKHGRWPAWEDAMAHCSDEMKACWRQELEARGVDIRERPKTRVMQIEIEGGYKRD